MTSDMYAVGASLSSEEYWNLCANEFDSLYTSRWSQLEDDRVTDLLRSLDLADPVVLDIGCGTGLGLRLLSRAQVASHYYGIDIAPKMIEQFQTDESIAHSVELAVADMATYTWDRVPGPDLVMSVFSSMSFSEARWDSLRRIASHQVPGGKMLLMALSRFSLRRLLAGNLAEEGEIGTRGSSFKQSVHAFFETPRTIKTNLEEMGYRVVTLTGDGPLSGIFEAPGIWRLNDRLGRIAPRFSYTLISVAEKTRRST
jgi:SAM-dependent methyltransferase